MKKLKILPSVLMLVACVAILGVGVFAVAPTQNTISGSITINASNLPIGIEAYKFEENDWATTPYFSESPVRSGTTIPLFENLSFDLSKINTSDEFDDLDIKIKIVITNSNNVKLGGYFSNDVVTVNAYDNPSVIAKEKPLTTTTSANSTAIKAVNDGYKTISANGSNSFYLTFKISDFIDADSINLENPLNKIYFNVEEAKDFTVTLNAGGNTITANNGWTANGTTLTKTVAFGESYGTLPTITAPSGKKYIGWEDSNGNIITDNQIKTDSSASFNAFCSKIINNVSLNANGGKFENLDGKPETTTIASTTVYELNNTTFPTYGDYVFKGWFWNHDGLDSDLWFKGSGVNTMFLPADVPNFPSEETIDEIVGRYGAKFIAMWAKTENDILITIDYNDAPTDFSQTYGYLMEGEKWAIFCMYWATPGEDNYLLPDDSLVLVSIDGPPEEKGTLKGYYNSENGSGSPITSSTLITNTSNHTIYGVFIDKQ